MLYLTYHRIAKTLDGRFYTVSVEGLNRHIDVLESRSFHSFAPSQLPTPGSRDCALTFDDGTADHFELALPALRARGWRGIFFVPTADLDRPGFLTREQARQMHAEGHILGCHSHEHRRLDTQSDAEIRRQLETSLAILREITGAPVEIFAPPGGFVDARVRRIAGEAGLRALRTMRWGLNEPLRPDDLECLPLNNRVSPERLARLLDGRGLLWMKTLYLGKELVKSIAPLRTYTQLRKVLFRPHP